MKRIFGKFIALSVLLTPVMFGASFGLPWERPLAMIAASLTGPAGYSIGVIGFVAAGVNGIWHIQHGENFSRVAGVVMLISLIVGASPLVAMAFGVNGCLI